MSPDKNLFSVGPFVKLISQNDLFPNGSLVIPLVEFPDLEQKFFCVTPYFDGGLVKICCVLRGKSVVPSRLLLVKTCNTEMVVWPVPPGGIDAVPQFCWKSPIEFDVFKPPFARIINEKIVLAKTDKRIDYTLQNRSEIVLANDRKTLIPPQGNRVLNFNAENGEIVFQFSTDKEPVVGANVDHSGKRLAGITNQAVFVWDLEKSADQEPLEFPAPLIGNPFGTEIEWIDEDHLLPMVSGCPRSASRGSSCSL